MMKIRGVFWCAVWVVFLIFCLPLSSWGGEPEKKVTFDEIIVEGEKDAEFYQKKKLQPNTESTVGQKGIKLFGGSSQTDPLKTLQLLPSVNEHSADAFGLAKPQSIKIRGKNSYYLGRTIDGLPITGEPAFAAGSGGGDLIDMENMEGITLYSGATPVDKGLGFSNAGGVVEMTMLKPAEEFTAKIKQSVGSYDFTRTFIRLDSGKLPWGSKLFSSFSYTSADKWRGEGNQRRLNGELGLTQKLSDRGCLELFGVWHDTEGHNYRPLNYAQAKQLSDFYRYDYSKTLTGTAAKDIYYYDFNRSDLTDKAAFGKVEFAIGRYGLLSFKPYYWKEDGYKLSGSGKLLGAPGITNWRIEHETYGSVFKYDLTYGRNNLVFGYWYQESEAPPPPTSQKAYRVEPDGSLSFAGWSLLAKHTHHKFNSPFVNLQSHIGPLFLSCGVRYLQYREASFKYYDGSTVPDVSYDDAFDYNPSIFPDMVAKGRTFREWLPSLGVNYAFRDGITLRANYGRGYARHNWGSVASTYSANRAKFLAAGITLQDLWEELHPEISDHFDLGMRYQRGAWYVEPIVFYGIYTHKQANIYDSALNVTYHQSTQEAHSYGAELSVGGTPLENFDVFFSTSYNRFTFDKDVRTAAGTLIRAKGNQVQDCPKWSAKLGATYRFWDMAVSPVVRYSGSRYGDMNNTQHIPSHVVADLTLAYEKVSIKHIKEFTAGISLTNLFNKKYIGMISGSEFAFDGSPGYYQGSPTTFVLSLSGKF